ncbi:ubiquinol-cytochrome c reductase iron-sulfur subunit [Fodinicola feengrottensis]|uniref:Cytochrome bc1 complex Rieske iron-sulfur subunit n=1 Tax=Fodinicola feengrottensis TaxID=435914 RepID=A0ABN2IFD4_9ACTN
MTTQDHSTAHEPATANGVTPAYPMPGKDPYVDANDPEADQFDLVREGARRDGVELVHYAPRFPVPGTKREKRVERTIAFMFGLSGLFGLAFLVVYIWWPYDYQLGVNIAKLYTPMLGITLGFALFFVGAAVITFAKKLLPEEVAVQDRHDGASPDDERRLTGATLLQTFDDTGIKRRPMLKAAIAIGAAPLGLAIAAPLVGALITNPGKDPITTAWKEGIRLVRDDGTPIQPGDMHTGSIETVFPGIPDGNTNKYADSPTLLIHMRPEDAAKVKVQPGYETAHYGDYFAYSKICTHAGCPASLYEQQTQRLLCPCHQSQFDLLESCKPVFGPASRRLPQLPIKLDSAGYFVAQSDYRVPIGPALWEHPDNDK